MGIVRASFREATPASRGSSDSAGRCPATQPGSGKAKGGDSQADPERSPSRSDAEMTRVERGKVWAVLEPEAA